MSNTKRIKILVISLGTCAILSITSISFSVFYLLSYILTTPGSALLLFLSIWLLLRTAVKILVFPGSCWFWKRSIEANFCFELSNSTYFKIRDLKQYLQAVQNQEKFNLQSNSSVLVDSILERLNSVSATSKLSTLQLALRERLVSLKNTLQETMVIIDSSSSKSLWDWLQERISQPDPTDIVYEDYPDCIQAKKLIKICAELEESFLKSCGTASSRKKLQRWLFDDSIGNIHYMREDLLRRQKCEQIWISNEGHKIDCLYLQTNPEGPSVLFCNPNAGFYEFAFYQSEWFEFYTRRGVNVMYWNYRGFGRSQGSPSLKKIFKDGEEIIRFMRDKKGVKVLGIHGESLGGAVACYLGNKCGANFLFADRTFHSLARTAFYNFGRCAYLGFKASRKDDANSARNFLDAKCYKVISCDPKDLMINDMASLKVGVANELLYSKPPNTHILLVEQMTAFKDSLLRISNLISQLSSLSRGNARVSTKYQQLEEDSDLFDDEKFKEAILKLKTALNGIEAGGATLLTCLKAKDPGRALVNWVLVLDVWGSSTISSRSSPIQTAVDTLKNIIKELESLMSIPNLTKEIQDIHRALSAIKTHIESRIDLSDSRSLSTSQEFKGEVDYEKAGNLLSLTCGHAGPFASQERYLYEQHLLKARFLSSK